jgi:WD40 repeat protein
VPEALLSFLQAGRNAATAALEAGRTQLRRMRRLQLGVGGLVALAAVIVVVAGLGVARLISGIGERTSNTLATLAGEASDAGLYDRAARYARAGLAGADWWLVGYDAHAAEVQLRRAAIENRATAVFRGHQDDVQSIVFSPDGLRVATGSYDRTVRLWVVRTGAPVGEPLRGFQHGVAGLISSPDGTRLVTIEQDRTVRLWDMGSRSALGRSLHATASAFSPDGTRLALATTRAVIEVRDARRWPREGLRRSAVPERSLRSRRSQCVGSQSSLLIARCASVTFIPARNSANLFL